MDCENNIAWLIQKLILKLFVSLIKLCQAMVRICSFSKSTLKLNLKVSLLIDKPAALFNESNTCDWHVM